MEGAQAWPGFERGGAGGMMSCSAKTLCVVGWEPRRPGANAGTMVLQCFVETWTFEEPAATAALSLLLSAAKKESRW